MMQKEIKSAVVLGVGAPNQCRDGKKTMCAILLSEEIGLFRVYPIPAESLFRVWSVMNVKIEKHSKDNRKESWRLLGFEATGSIDSRDERRTILNQCVLKSGLADPIDFQNENRSSIAVVRLLWGSVRPSLEQRVPNINADDEECGWIITQSGQPNKPYIEWKSEQGKSHKTHLVGREVYEGLRKNPSAPWNIFNNLQINVPDYEQWLLLGNTRDHRNIWVGVHLHRLKKNIQGSMGFCLETINGRPEGWPYCVQDHFNASGADNQLTLFTTSFISQKPCRGNMATTT